MNKRLILNYKVIKMLHFMFWLLDLSFWHSDNFNRQRGQLKFVLFLIVSRARPTERPKMITHGN